MLFVPGHLIERQKVQDDSLTSLVFSMMKYQFCAHVLTHCGRAVLLDLGEMWFDS